MRQSGMADSRPVRLKPYAFAIALTWTALIGFSLLWNIRHSRRGILDLACAEARGAFNKDLVYRRWAAAHGGVYVPVTEDTPPNPYLSLVQERDITTPSGRRLTLINPAYMTRQVHEMGQKQYGLRGHITSLNPIRPGNAPDPWEVEALQSFERGEIECDSVETIDGETYLRLMRPMITEERCLKCHGAQGYQVGEIRGGISVTMPLAPYRAVARAQMLSTSLGHGMMWVVGLAGIGLGFLRLSRRVRERERAEESLREAKQTYQALVDTIDGIVWEADAQTCQFSFVSKKAERLLGYPVERWLDEPTFWKDNMHPDDRERAVTFCQEATARMEDHEFDYRMIAADGRVVWLRDIVTVVVENDRPVKLRGIMVDITETKRRTEALLEARRDATIGRLAASVAHEVNNPLAAIKTQLSILKEDVSEVVPQAARNLRTVSEQVDRIARTVQNLLGFARQRSAEGKEVPLRELIRTVAGLFEHAFRAKGIHFEVSLPKNLPTIRGDADQLQGVFVNLLENARDLLGSGRAVSIRAEMRQDEVEVCVEDDGPGLGEDPEKVLEPFYTTKPNGVGIGLSIAGRICRAHGGRLLAENRPAAEGGGARFRIIFPLAEGPEPSGASDSVGKHEGTDR